MSNMEVTMSYSRWRTSEWYTFATCKADGTPALAVWHRSSLTLPVFDNESIAQMIVTGDLERIEGYEPEHKEELLGYFRRYLQDELGEFVYKTYEVRGGRLELVSKSEPPKAK